MKRMILAPSMMCADMMNVERDLRALEEEGIELLHIDVMDGQFVPNIALGLDWIRQLGRITAVPFDIHLMVTDADMKLDWIPFRKGDFVSLHPEACVHVQRALSTLRKKGVHPGLSLNPSTGLSVLEYLLDDLDYVNIMSVNPGFAGQPLIPACLKKVSDLKQMLEDHGRGDILIEMDGHVSPETAPKMLEAGATILVGGTGSVFAKGRSLKENIRIMKKLVE